MLLRLWLAPRQRVWSVMHDAQKGIDHLEAEGEMPAGFEQIRRELLAQQDAEGNDGDVDYIFDIPVETAKLVSGFSYNETEPEGGFVVLRQAG